MNKKIFQSAEFLNERYIATREDLKFMAYYLATPLYLFYWFTTDILTAPQFIYLGLALRLTVPLAGFIALKSYKFNVMRKHYLTPVMLFLIWGVGISHSMFMLNLSKYDYNKYFSINHLVMFGATVFTPLPILAILFLALIIYTPYVVFILKFYHEFSYHDYVQNLNAMMGTIVVSLIYTHLKTKRIQQAYLQKRALMSDASVGSRISQITHDLRTPLQALSVAKEISKDNAEAAASLLEAGFKRIQKLCQEILDTRESPYYSDSEISFRDFEDAIKSECSLFHPQEWIVLNFSDSTEKIMIDVSKIQRLVANLVNNAYKAIKNQSAPKVKIEIRLDSRGLYLSVNDNGIGFEAYEKAKDKDESKKGYGIGLEFCKQVCDYYGGNLQSKSQPGHTEVTALLPRVFSQPLADGAVKAAAR